MISEIYSKDVITKNGFKYINKAIGTGGMLIVKNDWCSHCRKTLPILEETSKKLGTAFPIFKLDGDTNKKTVELLDVEGFPTILYICRDGKVGVQYNGDRSVPGFLSGICTKSLICKK